MSSNTPPTGTDNQSTVRALCSAAAASSILSDHSYIHRFNVPNLNTRNTRITPERYSQLQHNITTSINQTNDNQHTNYSPTDKLNELKKDIEIAFSNNNEGYSYPDPQSNPLRTITIDFKNKKFAKYRSNSKNKNNSNKPSLTDVEKILTLPRSTLLKEDSIQFTLSPIPPKHRETINLITPASDGEADGDDDNEDKEEKSMDIDDDNSVSPHLNRMSFDKNGVINNTNTNGTNNNNISRKKITPLKRKLTEIIPNDETSPYQTPKPTKRRKLTHRRSSLHLSQTPFLEFVQRSMSLSQTPPNTQSYRDNNNNNNCNNIQNAEAHFNAFYAQFSECFEDIPLGYIDIERSTEYEQISWITVRANIESLAKCDEIDSISSKSLSNLLSLIDKQLSCSMEIELVTPPDVPFQSDIDNIAKGIECAIVALYIMTAKDIKRELIQQDILDKIVQLITFHISHNFAPCKDPQQRSQFKHCFASIAEPKNKKKRNYKSKKKKNVKKNGDNEYWTQINHQINKLYGNFCCSLLLLLNIYNEKEIVREQQLTQLLMCCFNTFDIQNIDDIQDGCKALIVTIFVKYEAHRHDICGRIMDYYRSLHKTYYAKRRITESKEKDCNFIHLINMLILEMCQSLSTKMLLHKQKELRQIQCMNTPINKQRHYKTTLTHNYIDKHLLFTQAIIKPMEDCKQILNHIIKGIVNIVISTQVQQHKDDKLVMFYKDLLNVWDLAEWPIAEYALHTTLRAFHAYLTSSQIQSNKQFKSFRAYFISGLAAICAQARLAKNSGLKNKICTTKKSELSPVNSSDPTAETEIIDCKCGNNKKCAELKKDILMIDCDDCHSWSHGKCVGILSSELIPTHWICDGCELNREIEGQLLQINAKHGSDVMQHNFDESTKLHILLINYLSKQLPTNNYYIPLLSNHQLSARQFHLIQWLFWKNDADKKNKHKNTNKLTLPSEEEKDLENEKKTRKRKKKSSDKEEMDADEAEDDKSNSCKVAVDKVILRLFEDYFLLPQAAQLKSLPTFSDFGIHRVNMQLALDRRLIALHDAMIAYISLDLQDSSSKIRTKALKSLKEICDIDASILSERHIKDRVIAKFKDISTSVREKATDLVGNYVIHDDALIDVYFDDLKNRINDCGISVRKRVIRIFRDICLSAPSNPKYKEICLCLFNKMSETNETIKKLVASTFEEMWFSDTNILQNRVKTLKHRGGNKAFSNAFKILVEQIIDSINSNNNNKDNNDIGEYLIDLIVKILEKEEKKTLRAQTKSDNDKTRVFEICEDMACVIIDKLTKYDFKSKNVKQWKQILPLINALYIFCRVRPLFLSKHFVTLQSYICLAPKKEDETYQISLNVIIKLSQILTIIIPFVDRATITKTSYVQLQKQMANNLWNTKLSQEVMSSQFHFQIMQTLCSVINNLSKDYKFMTDRIFDYCHGALYAKQNDIIWPQIKNKPPPAHIVKSLLFFGTAVKYFDINKFCKNYQFKEYKQEHDVLDEIYKIYIYFLTEQLSFSQYAMKGFIPLFCRKPSLMTEPRTIAVIKSFLNVQQIKNANEETVALQIECLTALHDFFETEERRTEFLQSKTEKNTNKHIAKEKIINEEESSDIESDAELSDEQEMKEETGNHRDVAGIRGGYVSTDTGNLIEFINTISCSITVLCLSSSDQVRNKCCEILLDWTASCWVNPIESLKEIISFCLDPTDFYHKTCDIAYIALSKIIERTPNLFHMNCIHGIVQCFKLYHSSLDYTFIDVDEKNPIINTIIPQNVPKLFGVLEEMNKSKQQQVLCAICRSIISYIDFGVCKKKIISKKNYLQIPMFVTYLCHFLCAMPFETYTPSQPYAVIQCLDNILKNNITHLTGNISNKMKILNENISNKKEILSNVRALYEYLCHGLMCLIIYQFREFWTKLYNLSDQHIYNYKLTANKKNKDKNFKTKKQQNGETQMLFIIDIKSKKKMIKDLQSLYQLYFIEKQIRLNKNNKTKRHNTRSGKKEEKYNIAPVLIKIEKEFMKMANEYVDEMANESTQTDSERNSSDDIDSDNENDLDIDMIDVEKHQKKKKR